jgi:putative PIG3 family NAD(P)H quinone oxidoreductase
MATVEAVVFRGKGGTDVIAIGETDVRDPGPGEIQIDVVAAGLNRADVLQRRGFYPAPAGTVAEVPGLELAGRVVARGAGAAMWSVGDEVMAIVPGGAMARRVTLHEREAMPVPRGIDVVHAAAIPEAFVTAWDAFAQTGLRAGEDVVVHAAASGVGTAAVQVARVIGARPIATTRSARKLDAVIALGVAAGDGIVVENARFATAVADRTGGRGAAVILDCVGGAYLEENVRAVATRGRIVMIGTLGGGAATAPIGMMLGKRVTLIGTVMRARPIEEKIAVARDAAARMVPLFERGALRPVIDAVMPMKDVAAAHDRMDKDDTVGKLVLAW